MEMIKFQGRRFPTRTVKMAFGERKISTINLNQSLLDSKGSYASEEARLIDEDVFSFVKEKALYFHKNKIVNKILSEI